MDISNLKTGDIIANYPKMCELLNEKPKKGNPRKRQTDNWKRFINYEKQGHKFYIIEIYSTELPKIDKRSKGNNSVYVNYTSKLLLDFIYSRASIALDRGKNFIDLTNNNIKIIVGLCNTNFTKNDEQMLEKLFSNKKLTTFDKNNFYNRTNTKHGEVIKSTLKRLIKSNNELQIISVYKITENNIERIANKDEEEIINNIHQLVLMEFYANKMFIIYAKNKQKEYYERVNELLETHNWSSCYKTYRIIFNDGIKNDQKIYILTEKERLECLERVNKLIQDYLDSNAEKLIAKQKESIKEHEKKHTIYFDIPESTDDDHRFKIRSALLAKFEDFILHEYYVENQKYLSEFFIKI